MAKYAAGLTTRDICKLEVSECEEILGKYKVSKEDVAAITGMIKEAYYQLSKACASGRAMERLLDETCSLTDQEKFARYISLVAEEEKRFEPNIQVVN